MRTKALVLAVVCLTGCLAARGQQVPAPKPDFSGTWKFDPERSALQITPPDASTFIIEHEEPHWRIERTHVYGDRSNTLAFELTTDGKPVTFTRGGYEFQSRLHWEGRALVLDSTSSRGDEVGTVVVRYILEDGGRTFVAEEHMESDGETHDNLWVFGRSAP